MTVSADVICLHDGRVMSTHPDTACTWDRCCVHRPSDHPLKTAPLFWDHDKRIMLRRCKHNNLHPDPDDLKVRTWEDEAFHYCDGCCEVKVERTA
ncbi:hypothetical protein JNUCC0626_20140 [Lentzea sp. JNUCC 0626]|uniref:hypothetical protein n=1 Tax=Lentzea sp. JNUCC 0626 TaxID=3367513 RepID=UPI00374A0F9B